MTAQPPPRAGRPPLDGDRALTVVQVRLSAAQIDTARRLGEGNLSAGVRRALVFVAMTGLDDGSVPWPGEEPKP